MGQQAVKSSALVVPEQSLEPLVPQSSHATASLATTSVDVLVSPPCQALALANCGPLIRLGALDEAYIALG